MSFKIDKKFAIKTIPFVFIGYICNKAGQAFRLADGANAGEKFIEAVNTFGGAFSNPLPSFHIQDVIVGIIGALLIKLFVYEKGRNAKKYRKGIEYGSARWGTPEDWKPYKNADFSNNVILTQTEHLTMDNRPPQPKYARNKNILVIGGSGSGKTRFFAKPNLLQMHSSYIVTDPNGLLL